MPQGHIQKQGGLQAFLNNQLGAGSGVVAGGTPGFNMGGVNLGASAQKPIAPGTNIGGGFQPPSAPQTPRTPFTDMSTFQPPNPTNAALNFTGAGFGVNQGLSGDVGGQLPAGVTPQQQFLMQLFGDDPQQGPGPDNNQPPSQLLPLGSPSTNQQVGTQGQFEEILPIIQQLLPGLGINFGEGFNSPVNPDTGVPDFRGQTINALSGIFGGDPFHLPGKPTATGMGLNILLQQLGQLQGRTGESEGILRGNANAAQFSLPAELNRQLTQNLTTRQQPGSLDAIGESLDRGSRERIASQTASGEQSLRDAGFLGQGASGADPLIALQANAARAQADAERQNLLTTEGIAQQRLAQASQGLGRSTDAFQALELGPRQTLAGVLQGPQNPLAGDLINALFGIGAGQQEKSLALRGGSVFDQFGGQLIGGLLGGAGQLGGAAIGASGSRDLADALRNLTG